MSTVPRPCPKEFRVARSSEASVVEVAKDFGISESCLHRWLAADDVEQGKRPGVSASESAELRELRLLQNNVLNRQPWRTREQLRIAIVTWIERTYHRRRR